VISDHNALAWVGTPSGRLLAKWSVVPPSQPLTARVSDWLDSDAEHVPATARAS
jgi:homoserine kinase type II